MIDDYITRRRVNFFEIVCRDLNEIHNGGHCLFWNATKFNNNFFKQATFLQLYFVFIKLKFTKKKRTTTFLIHTHTHMNINCK